MANIDELYRQSAADNIDEDGNDLTVEDPWIMKLDAPSSIVVAYNALILQGASFSFPALGDSHPANDSLKAIRRPIEHLSDQQTKFLITVSYSNKREDIDKKSNEDPLRLPAAYSYDQVDRNLPITIDAITELPIQNSAGKPFTDTLTENKPLTRITIVRNERNFNGVKSEDIKNTTNSVPTKIDSYTYETRSLKMESITASKQFDQQDRTYYTITYKVLVNSEGFTRKVIDRGDTNKNGQTPGNLVRGSDGAAYLNGEGLYLAPDAEIIVLEFNTLETTNWNGLRL